MDVDVAVLGGGPGGYTAAIRAAQLGASVACIEKEPELGGTCLRVGCIPTKAWVQTAHFLHQAEDSFAKLGVKLPGYELDFGIGLAEGYATIGGIGFADFWQYTVIGTVTNLAARLCKNAVKGQILVSHRMLALAESSFEGEPIGDMHVKGIHRPISVFNITGEAKGGSQ